MNLIDLKYEKRKLLKDCREILDKAESEKRNMTSEEDVKYKKIMQEVDSLADKILSAEEAASTETRSNETWVDAKSGQEIRVYQPGQKLPTESGLSLARCVRGALYGDWTGATAEKRALSEGLGSAGGFTVPRGLSNNIIQSARNRLVVQMAGARYVDMVTETTDMARIDTDATASWYGENSTIAESSVVFGRVTLKAHKCATLIKISKELFMDGNNVDQLVNDSIGYAVQKAVDSAALAGTGGTQPTGIANTTGIKTSAQANGNLTFDELIDLYTDLLEVNASEQNISFIMSPALWSFYAKRKDGEGQYATSTAGGTPEIWGKLRKYVSNQISTASNITTAYLGDFNQLMWGNYKGLEIMASEHAADGTNGAFTDHQIWIRAVMRMDIALGQPNQFTYISGISAV